MSFPSDILVAYTLVDNVDDVLATHPNTMSSEIRAIETKLGIDGSAVVTTIDYFLKHASGAYRTHMHDNSSDDGATLDWDTCWADAVHNHSSNAEGGTLTGLGAWDTKAVDTNYQATTDGFLIARAAIAAGQWVYLKTDGGATPSTIRASSYVDSGSITITVSVMTPVKKNDYYRIETTGSGLVAYWIPLGI